MKRICRNQNDIQKNVKLVHQTSDLKRIAMINRNIDLVSTLLNEKTLILNEASCRPEQDEEEKKKKQQQLESPSSPPPFEATTSIKALDSNVHNRRLQKFSLIKRIISRNKYRNGQQNQQSIKTNKNKRHTINSFTNKENKDSCCSTAEYVLRVTEAATEAIEENATNRIAAMPAGMSYHHSKSIKNIKRSEGLQQQQQKAREKQRNHQGATMTGMVRVAVAGDIYRVVANKHTEISLINATGTKTSCLNVVTPATTVAVATTPARNISHRKNKCSSNDCRIRSTTIVSKSIVKTDTSNIRKRLSTAESQPSRKNSCTTFTSVPLVLKQFLKLLETTVKNLMSLSKSNLGSTKTTNTLGAYKLHRVHGQPQQSRMPFNNIDLGKRNRIVTASESYGVASTRSTRFRCLPSLGATSFFTLLTLICLETVLLSTVSNCAKTFYMHWNTSNSIFRIDNTDHIIDVNKGNLAFEFDQVHIICPVYEPGTFENETEKYIIYNVSKVEYETCRITNADPRVIAICDKPQKLMFFTITFRPFTPQPGGLEFLPGNDYYFISTSSKDDLYRRIGGRCSTNNMKVVFKVCCAPEDKNKTTASVGSNGTGVVLSNSNNGGTSTSVGINTGDGISGGVDNSNSDIANTPTSINQHPHMNNINAIGLNGVNTGLMPVGGGMNVGVGVNGGTINNGGIQLKPMNSGSGTSINTNIDQFNRIPIQTNGINVMGNNIGGLGGIGLGGHGGGGIMLTPGGHGGINMISSSGGIGIGQYPGHPGQSGIRINNVASQQHHPTHKNSNNNEEHYEKHPNEVVKNEELTYNSGAASLTSWWPSWRTYRKSPASAGWILSCVTVSPVEIFITDSYVTYFNELWAEISSRWLSVLMYMEAEVCSLMWKNCLQTRQQKHINSSYSRYKAEFEPSVYIEVKFMYFIFNYSSLAICLIVAIVTSCVFKQFINENALNIINLRLRKTSNTAEKIETLAGSYTSSIAIPCTLNTLGTRTTSSTGTSFVSTSTNQLSQPATDAMKSKSAVPLASAGFVLHITQSNVFKVVQLNKSSYLVKDINCCSESTSITNVKISKSR